MVRGRRRAWWDEFLLIQEDAWERISRLLSLINNTSLIIAHSLGGGEIDKSLFKEPDDMNDWLAVPGVETPDEEKLRQENEIIAERRRNNGQQTSDQVG